jgi:hypothetical protein
MTIGYDYNNFIPIRFHRVNDKLLLDNKEITINEIKEIISKHDKNKLIDLLIDFDNHY